MRFFASLLIVGTFLAFVLVGAAAQQIQGLPDWHYSSDVEILVGDGIGAGVYIGNGKIVTAAHVVTKHQTPGEQFSRHQPKSKVKKADAGDDKPYVNEVTIVLDHDGLPATTKLKATVVDYHLLGDVALLHIDDVPDGLQATTLACREPKIGELLEVVGNPFGIEFVHTFGHVAGTSRYLVPIWPIVTPIDVRFSPGNSGGPAYDANGNVLGIIVGYFSMDQITTVNLMVPSSAICELMKIV